MNVAGVILWSFAVAFYQCAQQEELPVPAKAIEQVLKDHTDRLMEIPGVVGTAQGLCGNEPCIKVLVEQATVDLQNRIPPMLEGWRVEIEEVGTVRPL